MMKLDPMRVRAVVRTELRGYRRRRSIVATMGFLPLVFLIEPVLTIFLIPASTPDVKHYVVLPLLYLLLIPVIMPATLAAYSVVGEREQGTLEPLLTTPIRREELILGKGAAVIIPSVALSYTVYGLLLAAVALFAHAPVASAVFDQGPVLLALLAFAPLLAGWSTWVGMAISARASDVRVAQQLGTLAGLPPIGVIGLMAFGTIKPTFTAAALFALGLVAINLRALRLVSGLLDRERLVTGTRASRPGRRRSYRPIPLTRPPR
jgi:ABC-type transport system involved in multi-copper enzyme maturation permease subunit